LSNESKKIKNPAMKRKICRAIFFAELFAEIVSLLQTIWNYPISNFVKIPMEKNNAQVKEKGQ
jgi:hypothetical protein